MRRLSFLLLLAAGAACTSKAALDLTLPPTETNVTGTFTLNSANGRLVPYQAILTTTEVWVLTSDKIVLLANNSWVDTTYYSVTNRADGSVSPRGSTSGGTYEIANSQINFTMTAGGAEKFVGAVVNNSLSVNYNGLRYLYTR